MSFLYSSWLICDIKCVCLCVFVLLLSNTVADNLHLMNFNKIDLLLNNSNQFLHIFFFFLFVFFYTTGIPIQGYMAFGFPWENKYQHNSDRNTCLMHTIPVMLDNMEMQSICMLNIYRSRLINYGHISFEYLRLG